MFRKILIANRGELTQRVLTTARKLGLEAVTVHSTADRSAAYVADTESVCVGPAASADSYLNAENLIQAARQTQCAALHPGWGFLAENSAFAALCEQHGICFIGPSPEIMDLMGRKTPAIRRMTELGLKAVPGLAEPLTEVQDVVKAASEVGFPVMLKADSGGGGRGMRICRNASEVEAAAAEASREAAAAFSNPALYVERYVERGRHIEVQVMVDRFGQAVTLGERECSVQRKHQKLIEEAPSPGVSAENRQAIEDRVAAACSMLGYEGAGTVEFLMDESGELFFIEMNTRLQVEHPVTEMITGLDLVEQQLRVAAGHRISADLGRERQGHAIECRINAEDPELDFRPCPGQITTLKWPDGEGVRVDTHVIEGYRIPPFYDSLIAKLIVHADTREQAIELMISALENTVIEGVKTTIPFHLRVLRSEAFRSGHYHTGLVADLTADQKAGDQKSGD